MTGGQSRAAAAWLMLTIVLTSGVRAKEAEVAVRVLPQAIATNGEAFRLGFQVGFLEGPGNPLQAECLSGENIAAEGRATVKTMPDPNTGRKLFLVSNADDKTRGVSLTSAVLRKGASYTVRVNCRRVKGSGALGFVFVPVGGGADDKTEKTVSLKGDGFAEKVFRVNPHVDGAFVCTFQIAPGSVMEFASFSLLPDDAEDGWDPQSLEALRTVGPGVLRWPVQRGVGFYNWYDGVGPLKLRRAVSPTARAEDGHDFGTVEFVNFCRLVGAQPLVRVTAFRPGCADARVEDLDAAVRLAADWVAYCNATNGHPLAELRARHGHAAALGVSRWELVPAEGGLLDGATCRAYAAAMKAEDPTIQVGMAIEGPALEALEAVLRDAGTVLDFISCAAPETCGKIAEFNQKNGTRLKVADTRLAGVRDRYVGQVMGRLEAGDVAERRYYGAWYDSLAVAYAALERLRQGGGLAACTPYYPEQVLYRVPYARQKLADTGLLLALFNRFPAKVPLVTEGAPTEKGAPLRVQAAWTEDDSALVVYVYNSGTEPRTIRLDLTPLKRHFAFWMLDQLAADITAARQAGHTVPVNRRQKAGAALTQVVVCEAEPSSLTRVVVKE